MTQSKGWVVKIDESSVKYKGKLCIRGGLRDRKLSTDAFMRFAEEGKVRSLRERGGIKVVSVLEFGFRRGWEEQVSLCLGLRWIVSKLN